MSDGHLHGARRIALLLESPGPQCSVGDLVLDQGRSTWGMRIVVKTVVGRSVLRFIPPVERYG
jgi:hypothetical protein